MPNQIVLGFDFGLRHIGTAVGQMITKTAQALGSVDADHGIPQWQQIDRLIKEWKPNILIVGNPLNMDGSQPPLSNLAAQFANELKNRYQLPVELMDERLSTVEARSRLFEQGGYKALTKKAIDSMSAKLILENWLLIQNHSEENN